MYSYIVDKATRTGASHERRGLPNEDRAVIVQINSRIWMGVFDGVSKGGGGCMAASLASRCMESVLKNSGQSDIHQLGLAIMRSAQESILSASATHPEYGKMQTTGVVACIDKSEHTLTWFSIGDSAVFVCPKRKKPVKLTIEDTDIGEQLAMGKLSPKTAAQATVGHELNRWLGMDISPESIGRCIRTGKKELSLSDAVVVCSDGFYSKVPVKMLGKLARKNEVPEAMIKAARENGSQDDITVICAKSSITGHVWHIQSGSAIALALFLFACGFLCGVFLATIMKETPPYQRLHMHEVVPETAPTDTLTLKTEEDETV